MCNRPEISGNLFGVNVIKRTKAKDGTTSPLVQLMSEDDGCWHEVNSFDAFWLDDLIAVLKQAKQHKGVIKHFVFPVKSK